MNIHLVNMEATQRKVRNIPSNVKFATSRAINDMAKAVQTETLSSILPDAFTLRGNWQKPGTRFGFNAKFSNKTNLTATVGSRADWLDLQEHGGTKTAGDHRVAVPTPEHKPDAEKMTREKKPRALLADIAALESAKKALKKKREKSGGFFSRASKFLNRRKIERAEGERKSALRGISKQLKQAQGAQAQGPKAFIITASDGEESIVRRVGKRLRRLFTLTPRTRVPATLKFEERAVKIVNERYDAAFQARLKEALR